MALLLPLARARRVAPDHRLLSTSGPVATELPELCGKITDRKGGANVGMTVKSEAAERNRRIVCAAASTIPRYQKSVLRPLVASVVS